MSFPSNFVRHFTTEIWSLYGVGATIILVRLADRTRRRNIGPDDWVALQLIFWYTLLTVAFYKIVNGGGSNFMSDEEIAALTPETTAMRVIGSKWVLVSEQAMIFTIWSCKIIMLLVYRRLTSGLKQERWIKLVAAWVVIGFIAVQVALFASCRPFTAYWSVPALHGQSTMPSLCYLLPLPDPPPQTLPDPLTFPDQCWSYFTYSYVFAVFNITADVFTLIVGLPLLFSVQCPWQQKVPLIVVFGMGLFVIAAAIANKLYALDPNLLSFDYALWYNREAAVCVYVTNLPVIYSLLREVFPAIQRWGMTTDVSAGKAYTYNSRAAGKSLRSMMKGGTMDIEAIEDSGDLGGIQQTHQVIIEEEGIPGLREQVAEAVRTNGGMFDASGGRSRAQVTSEKQY
ncbi:hypothetical protein C1H76_7930 [Elsinoe australis]|uniref:Rhodopsin domain-containing protein n=1 Tax=Elsinoe australis TaxID=40998 RepID=A0A4V6DT90_9PEZI|nr:hypothetical protein C1H76_7930 [Elsinoe australis]